MNSRIFTAAGKQVEVASRKMTDLEAIHKSNMARRVILPNGFYNAVFLSRGKGGRLKPAPEGIMNALPLCSGTFAIIGALGKKLGKRLEREAYYEGQRKTLIIETEGAPEEVMVCCDLSPSGISQFHLFNAKTDRMITSHEGMLEAPEIYMRLYRGQTYTFSVHSRHGGPLETVGGVDTFSRIDDSAVGGLLGRGYGFDDVSNRRDVFLYVRPSGRFGVVWEASEAGATLEIANPKIQVVEKEGKLIVEGTPEQLAAAKEMLAGIR